jgi:hypothetical protein
MASLKRYSPGDGPTEIVALVEQLLPLLVKGEHAVLRVLQEQARSARVGTIELSGVGFFAELAVPSDAPLVEPPNMSGGDALIDIAGSPHGAGCVLFVRDGRLSLLEGYTHAGDAWPEGAVVLGIIHVFPIYPGVQTSQR